MEEVDLLMKDWTRFSRSDMQAKLVALVKALGLDHKVEGEMPRTEERDYYIVDSLREAVREWGVGRHHCFRGTGGKDPSVYERYRSYMVEHGIPCVEQDGSEGRWFILREEDDAQKWGGVMGFTVVTTGICNWWLDVKRLTRWDINSNT
jgi:hypothetical protein